MPATCSTRSAAAHSIQKHSPFWVEATHCSWLWGIVVNKSFFFLNYIQICHPNPLRDKTSPPCGRPATHSPQKIIAGIRAIALPLNPYRMTTYWAAPTIQQSWSNCSVPYAWRFYTSLWSSHVGHWCALPVWSSGSKCSIVVGSSVHAASMTLQ